LPMQAILNPPVIPQGFSIRAGTGYLATDEIARLLTDLLAYRLRRPNQTPLRQG
jgi:hypothetical protein